MAQRWIAVRPGGPEVFDFVSYAVPPPASGEVPVEAGPRGRPEGKLEVPMARTHPPERAVEAVELLRGRHPGGKVALLPA